MTNDIRTILEASLSAPSGDNTQPWRWKVRGEVLELWSVLRADSPYPDEAHYMTFGATIECAVIAASALGYDARVAYFPAEDESLHMATICLTRNSALEPDALAPYILERHTNRKMYEKRQLDESAKAAIRDLRSEVGEISLYTEREEIDALALAASVHETIIFSNASAHRYFFDQVRWTQEESGRTRTGFYLPTLEPPRFSQLFFWLLQFWPIAKFCSFFGVPAFIASRNRFKYRASAAMGVIAVENNLPDTCMAVGRLALRAWLTATSLGVSMQPLTGTLLFKLMTENKTRKLFSKLEVLRLFRAYASIEKVAKKEGRVMLFMFRLGYADRPLVQSTRLPFEAVVEEII